MYLEYSSLELPQSYSILTPFFAFEIRFVFRWIVSVDTETYTSIQIMLMPLVKQIKRHYSSQQCPLSFRNGKR